MYKYKDIIFLLEHLLNLKKKKINAETACSND